MTWFYCVNCLIATFAPIALYSAGSGIGSQFSITTHWKTFFCFLGTYFVKFLLLATVSDGSHEEESSLLSDCLMAITGLFDVLAISYLINANNGSISNRVQICAIGWTYAIAFTSKLFPIFTYSRAPQDNFYWLILGLKSIPQIFYYISYCYSIFMAFDNRKVTNKRFYFFYMLLHLFYPTLLKFIVERYLILYGWMDFILDTLFSFVLYLYSNKLFLKKTKSN